MARQLVSIRPCGHRHLQKNKGRKQSEVKEELPDADFILKHESKVLLFGDGHRAFGVTKHLVPTLRLVAGKQVAAFTHFPEASEVDLTSEGRSGSYPLVLQYLNRHRTVVVGTVSPPLGYADSGNTR